LIAAFTAIKGAITGISAFMTATAIPAFTGFGAVITGTILPAIGSFLLAAGPIIAVVALIAGLIALVAIAWKNDFGQVRTTWTQNWENMLLIFNIAWARMIEFFANAWNRMVEIATNIVNGIRDRFNIDWGAIGRNIVQGIANGIKAGIQWVIDAAAAVAQAAMDIINSVLDNHSPSREMMKIGKNMNLGLAAGLQNSMGAPVGAMGTVAMATASAARQFGDVNINLPGNVNNRIDMMELAKLVASELGGL
jgi:hypothetical protein